MARPARRGLALNDLAVDDLHPAERHQVFPFPDRADRNIRNPRSPGAPQCLAGFDVRWHLENTFADRLGPLRRGRDEQFPLDARFWDEICFDDFEMRAPLDS